MASGFINKQFVSVAPVNSGEQVFGYSSGLPQITFQMGSQGILQADELRLTGTLKIVANGAQGTNLTNAATDVSINAFTGVESCIDELEISSTGYGRSLEYVQHYGQCNASVNSALHSKSMYDSHLSHEQGSLGSGICTSQSLTNSLDDNPLGVSLAGQRQAQIIGLRSVLGREFSCRLVAGMFLGGSEISMNDLGGLTIRLKLAPNEQVLFGAAASGYHYEIHNPLLIASVMVESPEAEAARLANPQPLIPFLQYQSYYNNIISTDFSVVHRTNLAAVLSSFTHFVPSSYLNNYAQDGYAQYNPAINNITFLKDGQRVPLTYEILNDRDAQAASEAVQPSTNPVILYNYLSAWKSPNAFGKSSVNSLNSGWTATSGGNGVFGVGCSYDVEGYGVGARLSTLGFNIKSNLSLPSAPGTQTPFSAFTFYLCKSAVRVDRQQGVMTSV